MKKILIHLLKPLSFLPAILMMYLIYSFSAQTGEVSGALSYEVSYQIVETKNEVLNENKTYDELAYSASSIEFYVRKAAHMTEYCLLAIAISFPLYVYGVRGIRRVPPVFRGRPRAFCTRCEHRQYRGYSGNPAGAGILLVHST